MGMPNIKINIYKTGIQKPSLSIEAFAKTEFNGAFSGKEPRQDVKVLVDVSRTDSVPIFGVLLVAPKLGSTKPRQNRKYG
jgi:hypothetical protein